ncbi:hypothetical protein F2Q68_00046654 [Brassica cretica]|uniref:Uncharacterized protein n=1 Tax=Brassica cretica TaxID=69181 RepID=A0A8S9LLP7_BRACR|nr:hypothetical protein F2Q68_00046654 [Brassica cretica]
MPRVGLIDSLGEENDGGEKISFKAWAKFSCALIVEVKQIFGSSPPLRRTCVSVGLLLEDELNRWWFSSSTKYRNDDLKRNRDRVIEEDELQVKPLQDKITQLFRLVLLLPQALPLAMDQERRGRFVINKDEKSNTSNTFVFDMCHVFVVAPLFNLLNTFLSPLSYHLDLIISNLTWVNTDKIETEFRLQSDRRRQQQHRQEDLREISERSRYR